MTPARHNIPASIFFFFFFFFLPITLSYIAAASSRRLWSYVVHDGILLFAELGDCIWPCTLVSIRGMACMAENNGCAYMPSSNAFIPYNSAASNVYYSGLLSPQPPPPS